MAYTNFQNCTAQRYKEVIYSEDTRNKIKISFNGIELEEADNYCERLIRKVSVRANDGKKTFSLSYFVSQELELTLHNINQNIINDQVEISLGTLIDEDNDIYEYVPLGIFNIQDSPTTDKDKTVIKLRDNRVKFDFFYNAKPLMDTLGGKASYRQILTDICTQAGVQMEIPSFLGENIETSLYDNTIKGNIYVSYIAEQAGCFPALNRYGKLIFVPLNNLSIVKIPLSLIEKYDLSTPYNIQRLVYESGIIKYETSSDKNLPTLFLNSANPYITSQSQIDNIFNIVNDFMIDSVKTGRVIGNPALDPYDIIEIYGYYETDEYGDKHFVDDENTIVFRTLATYTETYNGKITHEYNTEISYENRTENVSFNNMSTFKKTIKTEIDNIDASLKITAEKTDVNTSDISSLKVSVGQIESEISNISGMVTTKESYTGGVDIDEVGNSEPVRIVIRPTSDNISYLYHSSTLFFGNNTFYKQRKLRFHNKTTNEDFDYILPANLLHYDNDNNDEYVLDYKQHINQVTKKVSYNVDGTTKKLDNEQTLNFDYPTINLTEGNYTVYLLGYKNAYISVTLLVKNIYTDQFYTKTETDSKISQKADEIQAGVSQELENYYTKEQTNSQIDIKATEINTGVSRTYETITNSNSKLSEAKSYASSKAGDAETNAKGYTDNQLQNYSNTTEMTTAINQGISDNNTAYVDIEVAKKVNNTDYTHAKIVAKINDNTSQAMIDADKVDINANDVLNILAGNTLNLTSKNIAISSTNFSVTKDGKITANSGDIGSWNIASDGLVSDFGFYIKNAENISSQGAYYNVGVSNIYTMSDLLIAQAIVNGVIPAPADTTSKVFKHYDLNNDGVIDNRDLLIITKIIGWY